MAPSGKVHYGRTPTEDQHDRQQLHARSKNQSSYRKYLGQKVRETRVENGRDDWI